MSRVVESGSYKNMSASALVVTGPGTIMGIFCASSSSGTCKVWDNTSGATTVLVNTFNLLGGQFYPMGFDFHTGLYITIDGTADITVGFTKS
jgi:hypothetical protein